METVITGLSLSSSASRDALIVALCAASAVFLPAHLLYPPPISTSISVKPAQKWISFDFACLIICRRTVAHRIFSLFWTPRRIFGAFIFTKSSREWSANTFSSGPCSASEEKTEMKGLYFWFKNQKMKHSFPLILEQFVVLQGRNCDKKDKKKCLLCYKVTKSLKKGLAVLSPCFGRRWY